jgi:uncharacterized membrane-anchored protein YitT (DUF2179 family)
MKKVNKLKGKTMSSKKALDKKKTLTFKSVAIDLGVAIFAGMVVATAFFFFQNSNGFAPGGVGGLATMTYHFLVDAGFTILPWAFYMVVFNLPLMILVTIFVDKKLGFYLIVYMVVQSVGTMFYEWIGCKPYSFATNGEDFELMFAVIGTGAISGVGFSIMLRHFGASGGTYAISALIKKAKPASNIAYVAFLLDSSVVVIAFFVYGFNINPALCTLINLFIANVVVDNLLTGMRNGYKFEIITDTPDALAEELMRDLGHGVTELQVTGMYSHTEKYMLVCIIRKKQVGKMMKIIRKYPGTFASFAKVNEVFGRFKQ